MTTITQAIPSYNKHVVFAAAALGLLLFGAGMTTLGSVAPWLKMRFLLDEVQTGTLFSILPIGILLGSLVFGPICDRFGYKYLFIACCLFMTAGFLGISHASTITTLKISVLLFGVGGGAMNGASSAAVADSAEHTKGAQLSLLGIFFGLGAFGMPVILASLEKVFKQEDIIAAFGWISLAVSLLYFFIAFPPSKIGEGFSLSKAKVLFTDKLILLIAFFLFCQSSFEGIVNNWTTTYLIGEKEIVSTSALYALSLYIGGYTLVRLLLGTVLRNVPFRFLMFGSIALLVIGSILLRWSASFEGSVTALIIIGAGLSAGFPLMLGIVAGRYAMLSATAFSFVLVIALVGNMLVNYLVGVLAREYGIRHFTLVVFAECLVMLVLLLLVISNLRKKEA